MNDQGRINRWAYFHCERENTRYIGGHMDDICPMQGKCPRCQDMAREALFPSAEGK